MNSRQSVSPPKNNVEVHWHIGRLDQCFPAASVFKRPQLLADEREKVETGHEFASRNKYCWRTFIQGANRVDGAKCYLYCGGITDHVTFIY